MLPSSEKRKVIFDEEDDESSSSSSEASVTSDDLTPSQTARAREETDERKEVEKYSSQESKDVCTWKFLVIMLLVVIGGFASATTYKFIQDVEQTEFVNEVNTLVRMFRMTYESEILPHTFTHSFIIVPPLRRHFPQ